MIEFEPLALRVRSAWAATIRPFLPLKAEPAKVLEHSRDKFRSGARTIEIFIAENQHSAWAPGSLLSDPERAGVPKV